VEKFQKYLVVIRYADIGSKVPVEKISGNRLSLRYRNTFPNWNFERSPPHNT